MFSKPTSKPAPARPQAEPVPIPPLPDLNAQRRPPSGAAPAVAAAPARAGSVLSVDLTLEGGISGAGDLQIDGTVKGDVRVSRLVVGETGNVEGAVTCDSVEVRGRIVGSVNAKAVKLTSTAYVDGDIAHEQLAIDVGAYFQGRCIQGRPAAAAAQPAPAPAPAAAPVTAPQPAPAQAQVIEMRTGG